MTTSTERRRNMRAANCRACGMFCGAGAGWLYRDTRGTPNRYTGRPGWFVKCDGCHEGKATKASVRGDHAPAAPRSWSVSQVKAWAVGRGEHDGDVAVVVTGSFGREVVSFRDRITSRFTGYTGYSLEEHAVGGRPLSKAAAADLNARILPLIVAVQREEQAAGEAAVARLVEAGGAAKPCATGHGWNVEIGGGRYYVWGNVDGGATVSGHGPDGRWAETTVADLAPAATA